MLLEWRILSWWSIMIICIVKAGFLRASWDILFLCLIDHKNHSVPQYYWLKKQILYITPAVIVRKHIASIKFTKLSITQLVNVLRDIVDSWAQHIKSNWYYFYFTNCTISRNVHAKWDLIQDDNDYTLARFIKILHKKLNYEPFRWGHLFLTKFS